MSQPLFGEGPYHLSARALDSIVTRNGPGAFVLGEHTEEGFVIAFVGRAEIDVNASLRLHVGKYRHFLFDYTDTAQDAFERECGLFHDFHPGHNTAHPEPLAGRAWGCPRCQPARLKAA
jgi:hypothetical protein